MRFKVSALWKEAQIAVEVILVGRDNGLVAPRTQPLILLVKVESINWVNQETLVELLPVNPSQLFQPGMFQHVSNSRRVTSENSILNIYSIHMVQTFVQFKWSRNS